MIKSLRSLPEYKQLSRSVKRLAHLTVLNEVNDTDYDLSIVRQEIHEQQRLLSRSISEGSKQYKEWTDHSKLYVYTVITYHDYEEDNSFHYHCVNGDYSEEYREHNHRVIITDKKLPELDYDSKSLNALCGEWMSLNLYNYIKLTLENFSEN
ncbi:hypothetical protein AGENTSMITH_90 [Bacillus phage vB_BspM_AgentSmith]|nr:hypothetical protein AGENTSMITH_90 [Bacillus phage vB_BspM_AgentSmith]